jgi:hypothetical protein
MVYHVEVEWGIGADGQELAPNLQSIYYIGKTARSAILGSTRCRTLQNSFRTTAEYRLVLEGQHIGVTQSSAKCKRRLLNATRRVVIQGDPTISKVYPTVPQPYLSLAKPHMFRTTESLYIA